MNKGKLEKWSNILECNNLLFFSQLVNELLFDYSIPSNRISTLNSHYLCLDALSAIEGIEQRGVPEGTLKPIMEELYSAIGKDPAFLIEGVTPLDYYAKYQNGKYTRCSRVSDMNYEELKNTAYAIYNSFFNDNKYYSILKSKIIGLVEENDISKQKELFRLTKSLLTELMNAGYTLHYLYMTMNNLYWNPRNEVESAKTINGFFDAFDFSDKEYTVVFKVNEKEMQKFLKFIDDIDCIQDLPSEIGIRVNNDFPNKAEDEAFLIQSSKGKDPFGAVRNAIYNLETNTSVYRIYNHKYSYRINDAEYIVLDDRKVYYKGSSLNPMDHTKMPSDIVISEGMELVETAVKSIDHWSYYDIIQVINAIRYHSHSLDSESEENQLLDLWAIIETILDIRNKHTSDRIMQICMFLVPLLKCDYLFSLFKQLSEDIRTYNLEMYKSIVDDTMDEKQIVRQITEFTLLEECAELRESFLEKCEDFPLLKERISYYNEVLNTPANIHAFVEKHAERVRWQIMRIYRNRNLIIHNGRKMPYLSLLIENLHSYVDDLLSHTIHALSQKKSITTMCQELFIKECNWNKLFLRGKGSVDKETIKLVLSE